MRQLVPDQVIDWGRGFLRIQPVELALNFPTDHLKNMGLYVRMSVNELNSWESTVKCHGGRNPRWRDPEYMQIECSLLEQLLYIEIRILTRLGSEVLGGVGFYPNVFKTVSGNFEA